MRKIVVIIFSFFVIMMLAGCMNSNKNNSKYVGEWYYSEDTGAAPLVFSEDGTAYVEDGDSYKFEAKEDSVTLVSKSDGQTLTGYLKNIDGFYGLEINEILYIKGYEDAVSYYKAYCYDPSDIWSYDFSGEYYEESGNDDLKGLSEYEKMVRIKTEGGHTVSHKFTLTNNYSGYKYGQFDTAVTVDIDRENYEMKLVEPSGYIAGEYTIEWCDEIQEYYFISKRLEDYCFRHDNVK